MDNARADIIAGIRELRARAVEQLTGNDYYMIVQQLDSLAANADLSDDAVRSMMDLVSAKLQGGAAVTSSAGGPEVPSPADTPAEPETPSTPEEPVVPDSPAQPEYAPGPDVPTPPNSPAEPPPAPPEISASGTGEPIQIIKPRANSFGLPQATVGVRFDEPSEPPSEDTAPATKPAGGLAMAVHAARRLVEQKLSGNTYYAAANLLGQLQMLPPTHGGDEIAPPDGFEGALALLRREAAHLTGTAQDEAARIIAALENVLIPSVAAKPAEAAASPSTEVQSEAAPPELEPGPRTGFDDLADAAWRRVQQVSAADLRPAGSLNGATAPATPVEVETAPPPAAPTPAPEPQVAGAAAVSEAAADMMQQDNGEAFNDGGFESRSSEPCYLTEFEPAGAWHGQSDGEEPAAQAGAGAPSEAQCEAAVPAQAPEAPLSASASADLAPEQTAADLSDAQPDAPAETGPEAETSPAKPARRGLFGRLFGSAAPKVAEIR